MRMEMERRSACGVKVAGIIFVCLVCASVSSAVGSAAFSTGPGRASGSHYPRGLLSLNTTDLKLLPFVPRIKLPTRTFPLVDTLTHSVDSLVQDSLRKKDLCHLRVDESLAWLRRHARMHFPLASSQPSVDVSDLTEAAIKVVDSNEWEFMQEKHGVKIWKAKTPPYLRKANPTKYPCIKCEAVINASPEEVVDLMTDSSRVHEYNKFSTGRTDVETFGPFTKVVWNRTRPPLTMKGHDFCTLIHCFKLEDGSHVMVSKSIEHPLVPKRDDYIRSEILFGVSVMSKAANQRTRLMSISHMRYGGVPSYIANKVCVQAAHDFMRQVQLASSASTSASPPPSSSSLHFSSA